MNVSYIDILRDIYNLRKKKNPAYSMSKFSRDAGFKSYHLSDVLAGRYGLSTKRAAEVADKLKMPENLKKQFMRLVEYNSAKSKEDKNLSLFESTHFLFEADKKINAEEFNLTSEWYYFALIELIRKSDQELNFTTLSHQLKISEDECEKAVNTMLKLGYLVKSQNQLKVHHSMISLSNEAPSETIRQYHRTMIAKSLESMKNDPVNQRYFGSFNLNISKENYKSLHEEISAFIRKKIIHYQKDSEAAQRLYCLNFQLFPLESTKEVGAINEK